MSAVEIDSLSHRYGVDGSGYLALDSINLSIADREFIAIVGPSGCGKTTLLRVAAGLLAPSEGELRIGGRPPSESVDVGVVFQAPTLMPWLNVQENILLASDILGMDKAVACSRSRALIEMVGLGDFAGSYPHQLSGGMQQRVALCRALVHQPNLLLLDEPFGALDALTRERMNTELLNIWTANPTTVLLITHSIAEAVFLADRVVVMKANPGEIVDDIKVDLPRPRSMKDMHGAVAISTVEKIHAYLDAEGAFG